MSNRHFATGRQLGRNGHGKGDRADSGRKPRNLTEAVYVNSRSVKQLTKDVRRLSNRFTYMEEKIEVQVPSSRSDRDLDSETIRKFNEVLSTHSMKIFAASTFYSIHSPEENVQQIAKNYMTSPHLENVDNVMDTLRTKFNDSMTDWRRDVVYNHLVILGGVLPEFAGLVSSTDPVIPGDYYDRNIKKLRVFDHTGKKLDAAERDDDNAWDTLVIVDNQDATHYFNSYLLWGALAIFGEGPELDEIKALARCLHKGVQLTKENRTFLGYVDAMSYALMFYHIDCGKIRAGDRNTKFEATIANFILAKLALPKIGVKKRKSKPNALIEAAKMLGAPQRNRNAVTLNIGISQDGGEEDEEMDDDQDKSEGEHEDGAFVGVPEKISSSPTGTPKAASPARPASPADHNSDAETEAAPELMVTTTSPPGSPHIDEELAEDSARKQSPPVAVNRKLFAEMCIAIREKTSDDMKTQLEKRGAKLLQNLSGAGRMASHVMIPDAFLKSKYSENLINVEDLWNGTITVTESYMQACMNANTLIDPKYVKPYPLMTTRTDPKVADAFAGLATEIKQSTFQDRPIGVDAAGPIKCVILRILKNCNLNVQETSPVILFSVGRRATELAQTGRIVYHAVSLIHYFRDPENKEKAFNLQKYRVGNMNANITKDSQELDILCDEAEQVHGNLTTYESLISREFNVVLNPPNVPEMNGWYVKASGNVLHLFITGTKPPLKTGDGMEILRIIHRTSKLQIVALASRTLAVWINLRDLPYQPDFSENLPKEFAKVLKKDKKLPFNFREFLEPAAPVAVPAAKGTKRKRGNDDENPAPLQAEDKHESKRHKQDM